MASRDSRRSASVFQAPISAAMSSFWLAIETSWSLPERLSISAARDRSGVAGNGASPPASWASLRHAAMNCGAVMDSSPLLQRKSSWEYRPRSAILSVVVSTTASLAKEAWRSRCHRVPRPRQAWRSSPRGGGRSGRGRRAWRRWRPGASRTVHRGVTFEVPNQSSGRREPPGDLACDIVFLGRIRPVHDAER